jgi:hypothetical protein
MEADLVVYFNAADAVVVGCGPAGTIPWPQRGHRVPSGWCGPVGPNGTTVFPCPTEASRSNVSAQFHWIQSTTMFPISVLPNHVSDLCATKPRSRSLCHQTTFPIPVPPNHVPDPMPCRGIAYQPRVQTLGIHPEKETRVLKERRILLMSRTSTPAHPMRCSFRTHPVSRMRFPGLAPWAGMHCPVGANRTMTFPITRPWSQRRHRVSSCWCGPVGANGTMASRSRVHALQ